MRRTFFICGFMLLASAAGCGQPQPSEGPQADGNAGAATNQEDSPAIAVQRFLEAVRAGNDEASAKMLTPVAREKTAEYEMVVAPPGSDTASFKIGEVEMIGEEDAYVASFWTDIDEHGEKHTDTIIWMVRKEVQGWRIAGMATRVFDDEPAMVLNFEQPEDMLAKQREMEEEMSRRAGSEIANESGDKTADSRIKGESSRERKR